MTRPADQPRDLVATDPYLALDMQISPVNGPDRAATVPREAMPRPWRMGVVGLGIIVSLGIRLWTANGLAQLDSGAVAAALAAASLMAGVGLMLVAAERDRVGPTAWVLATTTAVALAAASWLRPHRLSADVLIDTTSQQQAALVGFGAGGLLAGVLTLAMVRRSPTSSTTLLLVAATLTLAATTVFRFENWTSALISGLSFGALLWSWDRSPRTEPVFHIPATAARSPRALMSLTTIVLAGLVVQIWLLSDAALRQPLPAALSSIAAIVIAFIALYLVRLEIQSRRTPLSEWAAWANEIRTNEFQHELHALSGPTTGDLDALADPGPALGREPAASTAAPADVRPRVRDLRKLDDRETFDWTSVDESANAAADAAPPSSLRDLLRGTSNNPADFAGEVAALAPTTSVFADLVIAAVPPAKGALDTPSPIPPAAHTEPTGTDAAHAVLDVAAATTDRGPTAASTSDATPDSFRTVARIPVPATALSQQASPSVSKPDVSGEIAASAPAVTPSVTASVTASAIVIPTADGSAPFPAGPRVPSTQRRHDDATGSADHAPKPVSPIVTGPSHTTDAAGLATSEHSVDSFAAWIEQPHDRTQHPLVVAVEIMTIADFDLLAAGMATDVVTAARFAFRGLDPQPTRIAWIDGPYLLIGYDRISSEALSQINSRVSLLGKGSVTTVNGTATLDATIAVVRPSAQISFDRLLDAAVEGLVNARRVQQHAQS